MKAKAEAGDQEAQSQLAERKQYQVRAIPELNINLHEGVFCNYDEEEKEYLPDFSLTVIMEADMEKKEGEWLYYEQDGFEITLASYQNGKMAMEAISELSCFICIPDDEPETE